MIKTRVLNELTEEVAARESEAYACDPQGGYGPGHCGHAEHKALRYAAFRRKHPNGLQKAGADFVKSEAAKAGVPFLGGSA